MGKRRENATELVEPAVWSVSWRTARLDIKAMSHTVLIVDDHGTFRATARILLEAEGFHVVGEAEDGATAVMEACRRLARTWCCSTCSFPTPTASTSPTRSPAIPTRPR